MIIETKFNINDLVQEKYAYPELDQEGAYAFEVIEIHTNNCYTTAQVFYTVRPVFVKYEKKFTAAIEAIDVVTKIIGVSAGRGKDSEYAKYREDELKPCSAELLEIITKHLPLNP